MITQFRNLNFVNVFFLIALTLVLRIGVFVNLPEAVNSGFIEFFNRLLINFNLDSFLNPIANILIAALLVVLQALLFNQMVNKHGVLNKSTFLPAACYILACSIFTPFLTFTPPLLCNFFLLFIFNKIIIEYKSNNSIAAMFDLGLVVAFGTLFYFPFVIFLVLLWVALFVFKPFYWREWASALAGFITLVFLLGVYYYWNNKLLDFYEIWAPLSAKLPIYINIQVLDYIVLFPIIICVLLGMLHLRQNFFKSFVLVRKSFQLCLFIFLLAIVSFYLKTDFRINHFLLCALPVALTISYYFVNAKNKWIYESMFLFIISFIIYFQFV
ncbi:DUF6427 family protein [Pedobacter alpinus]|uniref:DUF6427 family protein n=1 Tax=Pedobacter alpinus TaxID=1590643 RepID=A0ABW5TS99_9SPHI